jgi:hypothetical protein
MFREGQAYVKDVVKTAKEVQAIGNKVLGFWGELKAIFGFKPKINEKIAEKPQKTDLKQSKRKQEFDANAVYSQIGKNITDFFKAYNALKDHIAEEEEKSKTVYDPTGDQTEKAVQRVLALSQMETMQVELREYMVYHVPPELKDLYTRINQMIGTIQNEQALARQAQFKKRRQIEAEEREVADKIWFRTASTIAVIFVSIYIMSFMWALKQMTGDM